MHGSVEISKNQCYPCADFLSGMGDGSWGLMEHWLHGLGGYAV